jgi:hypothetical protein
MVSLPVKIHLIGFYLIDDIFLTTSRSSLVIDIISILLLFQYNKLSPLRSTPLILEVVTYFYISF